jgi:hypothetical protein
MSKRQYLIVVIIILEQGNGKAIGHEAARPSERLTNCGDLRRAQVDILAGRLAEVKQHPVVAVVTAAQATRTESFSCAAFAIASWTPASLRGNSIRTGRQLWLREKQDGTSPETPRTEGFVL